MNTRRLPAALAPVIVVAFTLLSSHDGHAQVEGALPTEGLVALYKFDETEGDVAFDSAIDDGAQDSIMPNGTIAWSQGLIGGALDLDGNSSMQAEDAIPFGTPGFTMTAWIFPRSEGSYKGIYASRATPDPNYNWGLNVENAPLRGDLRFANGDRSHGIDTPNITLNQWHHLAITYASDGATTTGIGYLNGVAIGTYNSALPVYQTNSTYQIGNDDCCGNRQFNGLIDEISVWEVTLSPEQIATIHSNGRDGIGIDAGGGGAGFRILSVDYDDMGTPDTGDDTIKLTWTSREGDSYTVRYTTDLGDWSVDLDDGHPADPGETTTLTINRSDLPDPDADRSFFRIER